MASPASRAASASSASCSAGGRHLPHRVRRREVQRGDAAAAPAGRRPAGRRRPARRRVRSGPTARDEALRADRCGGRPGRPAHAAPVLGWPTRWSTEGDRAAEDGEQPVASGTGSPRATSSAALDRRGRDGPAVLGEVLAGLAPRSRSDSISRTSPSSAWSGSAAALSASSRPSWKTSSSGSANPVSARSCSSRLGAARVGEPEPGELPAGRRGPRASPTRRR